MSRLRVTYDIDTTLTAERMAELLAWFNGVNVVRAVKVVELPPRRDYHKPLQRTLDDFAEYDRMMRDGVMPEQAVADLGRNLASFARLAHRNGRRELGRQLARIDYVNRQAGRA
jgi:hypothetical protein